MYQEASIQVGPNSPTNMCEVERLRSIIQYLPSAKVNFIEEVESILSKTGPGHNTETAYDTAWVARLGDLLPEEAGRALTWLRKSQLSDGSWGVERPIYYHDRILCTLSAVIALQDNGDEVDRDRIKRALLIMQEHICKLHLDPAGATAGFEMLLPVLLEEAHRVGIIVSFPEKVMLRIHEARRRKIALIPNGIVSRHVTMAFSAEMAGSNGREILDCDNLTEANGSVALSPSATAFYLLNLCPDDQNAQAYIKTIAQEGAPNFAPFDIYEKAWVVWNLLHVDLSDFPSLEDMISPIVDSLHASWDYGKGVGFSDDFSPRDADDTAVVFEVLSNYGIDMPIADLLRYEEIDHFRCFDLETHTSTGANIHMLGALFCAGYGKYTKPVQKILRYLRKTQIDACMWVDKWHISPYYITAHAVIVFANYHLNLGKNSVHWMIETQNSDGSWGYQFPTAEETAYCLQALVVWQQHGFFVPIETILKGYCWLKNHLNDPIVPLWTAKTLYSPTLVVRTAILSALLMVEQAELELAEAEYEKEKVIYPF